MHKPQQKSFSMTLKRGQKRPKIKMAEKAWFWNLNMNFMPEDNKNIENIKKNSIGRCCTDIKIQLLYYCGLNAFATEFAKWPLLRSDYRAGQIFLKLSYIKGSDKCPKEQFSDLKVNASTFARFSKALQIWMPHPVQQLLAHFWIPSILL